MARSVLRASALFGDASVPESLVMKLDPDFSSDILEYMKIIEEELVNGSSLLDLVEDDGETVFRMHRLMREFVLNHDRDECAKALNLASTAIHASVRLALQNFRLSIGNPPKWCSLETRLLLPHAVSVLHYFCSLRDDGAVISRMEIFTELLRVSMRAF